MLSIDSQHRIEELIIEGGLLTKDELEKDKVEALQANQPLLAYLVDKNLILEEDLTRVTAQVSGVPYVNLSGVVVKDDILRLLPKDTAERNMSVPFGLTKGRLAVAMLDPTNIQAVDFISRKSGQQLTVYMASRESIERILGQYHVELNTDVKDAISGISVDDANDKATKDKKPRDAKELQTLVQDAPITRALNAILENAAISKASDIHVEPREHELKIRFRIDGILQDTMTLPKSIEPALISRIKILSNMKIDEHRVPQDGQFQINAEGRDIDLRIAIAPVVWGEQVVIRLLDKSGTVLTLDSLGFKGRALRVITEGMHRPHGMTLSTGPTGSGKSTTLYAVVQAIKDIAINIVTLEDPVEYKMDGINQIQVNAEVGLTFASGLRSILRQDPNVVLVGEIRDGETANLAVQAALTGHTVLSTIHTNSASGVLPRLLDMDIEPFLIASTVNTVIGQRLVRRLCSKCKEESQSNQSETKAIIKGIGDILPKAAADVAKVKEDLGYDNLPLTAQTAYTIFRAKGCSACTGGYKGRVGIYEVLAMSEQMEKMVAERATTTEIQALAQKEGMLTMQQDGYLKALNGLTTLEEVARVATEA